MNIEYAKALALVRSARFCVFSHHDYEVFAGVKSAFPMIAENDGFTLILDGETFQIYNEDMELVEVKF